MLILFLTALACFKPQAPEDTGPVACPPRDTGDSTSVVDSHSPADTGPTVDSDSPVDTGPVDADGDGSPAAVDCDDADPEVYPGAAELCNNRSDDCDEVIDEGLSSTIWYLDADGDGYGTPEVTIGACDAPEGYVANGADCDDSDSSLYNCARSCVAWLALGGVQDGAYTIDPDGPGGLAPYSAWCEQGAEGGGWTLVLDRTHSDECCVWPCYEADGVMIPTTLSAGLVAPDSLNTGMDEGRFAALLAVSTEALALGFESHRVCADSTISVTTTLAALQSGRCVALGTDLTAVPLAWDELSEDCSGVGYDYSLWFGDIAPCHTALFDFAGTFGFGAGAWHPGSLEMYVR